MGEAPRLAHVGVDERLAERARGRREARGGRDLRVGDEEDVRGRGDCAVL